MTKKATATAAAYTAARVYYDHTAETFAAYSEAYDAAKAAGSRQIVTDAKSAIARLAEEINAAGPAAHVEVAKAAYSRARAAYEADPTTSNRWNEQTAHERLDSAYLELAQAEQAAVQAAIQADGDAAAARCDAREAERKATGASTQRPAPPALAAIAEQVIARDEATAYGRTEQAAAAQHQIDDLAQAYHAERVGATGAAGATTRQPAGYSADDVAEAYAAHAAGATESATNDATV